MPKITLENGEEVQMSVESYNELSKAVRAKSRPKSWEELNKVSGYYANTFSIITEYDQSSWNPKRDDKNIFATKEQAEASIAMAQLSQLMAVYNDGWVPDWDDSYRKSCIVFSKGKFSKLYICNMKSFLTFKTDDIRNEFFNNFQDLMKKAKPLL